MFLGWFPFKIAKQMNSMQNSGCHGNRKEKLKKHAEKYRGKSPVSVYIGYNAYCILLFWLLYTILKWLWSMSQVNEPIQYTIAPSINVTVRLIIKGNVLTYLWFRENLKVILITIFIILLSNKQHYPFQLNFVKRLRPTVDVCCLYQLLLARFLRKCCL